MRPETKNSWTPSRNETHFLLPPFRRVIFCLCLLSLEGCVLWQCTDPERLSPLPFLIIPFGVCAVSLFLHCLSRLGIMAESGLMRCSVCLVEFFPLSWQPVLSPFCLLGHFFTSSPLWLDAPCPFFLLPTPCYWISAPSTKCTIASLVHRLTRHGLSAETDSKCCHTLC